MTDTLNPLVAAQAKVKAACEKLVPIRQSMNC